jgi:hypothetical protein
MNMRHAALLVICVALLSQRAEAKTWLVGMSRNYTVPSQVMPLAGDGDTVIIDGGPYVGDVGEWTQSNLTIKSVNGRARLQAHGNIAQSKAIWIVSGNNTSISGIEFSGARISAGLGNNGSGIRQQGNNLTLRDCNFIDNQEGILGGGDTTSDVDIESCEFGRNGAGDGYSHNMYIAHVHKFTLKYCYIYAAVVGHEVKSRAKNNVILYNQIFDGGTGTASYNIDLPNGGLSLIMGNTIIKGPMAQNHRMIRYGEEGLSNPDSELFVISNSMVTNLGSTIFVAVADGAAPAIIENNIAVGGGTLVTGPNSTASNFIFNDTAFVHFVGPRNYDLHLTKNSPKLAGAHQTLSSHGMSLVPTEQYELPLTSIPRTDLGLTAGAFQAVAGAGVSRDSGPVETIRNFPNPFSKRTTVKLPFNDTRMVTLTIYDSEGRLLASQSRKALNGSLEIEPNGLSAGEYFYSIESNEASLRGRFLIVNE